MAGAPDMPNVNAGGEETTTEEEYQGTCPIGEGDYVVKQGDCISSVAMEHGFAPETIWNDPANSELKNQRKNPNTLLPDDRVTIPERRRKEEPGESETLHRFRLKGQPETLRIRLLDMFDNPRKDVPYTITIDGEFTNGTTDANGELSLPIPPNARKAKMILGEEEREVELNLGNLDPVSAVSGVQARLNNLGFDCGPVDGQVGEHTRRAVTEFQEAHDLEPTGNQDEATQDKIKEEHGH